jgi:acetyltransferase
MVAQDDARTAQPDVGRRDVDGRMAGTVRLVLAAQPNGLHRAEVVKLLVRRDAGGRGYSQALMRSLEDADRDLKRRVLMLDTQTGNPAERLYQRWGSQRVGTVDGYAPAPDGRMAPSIFITMRL